MKPCVTLRRVHDSAHRSSRFGNGRTGASFFGPPPKEGKGICKIKGSGLQGTADSRQPVFVSVLVSSPVSAVASVVWFDPLKG